MKVQGRVKKLMPMQSGISRLGNSWRRQDFILEYFSEPNDQYADTVLLQVMNDKIEDYALAEGEEVVVDFRHNVRSYGDRIYNEIYIRDLKKVGGTSSQAQAQSQAPAPTAEQQLAMEKLKQMGEQATSGEGGEDDVPF